MTNFKLWGAVASLVLLPMSAFAWDVVDQPVDIDSIPAEYREASRWVVMTPHPNAARENLYGINSKDNPAAIAFLQANRQGFRAAAAGDRNRIDHTKDFGPFLGLNYNIPIDLLPANSEAWEGLIEAGIVEESERPTMVAASTVVTENEASVVELYQSLEREVAAIRANLQSALQERQELAGLVGQLAESVLTRQESDSASFEALWNEVNQVRDSIPSEVDLRPIEDSLATLTAAQANIKAGVFTEAMAETLAQQVETTLGTLPATVAEHEAQLVEISLRVDTEVAAREAGDTALDGRITTEVDARAAGDAALGERIGGVSSEVSILLGRVDTLQGRVDGLSIPDVSGMLADLEALQAQVDGLNLVDPVAFAAVETELQSWREGELPQAARNAIELMLSDIETGIATLRTDFEGLSTTVAGQGTTLEELRTAAAASDVRITGIADDVTELRTDFELAQAYPLRWLYAPLGLSEWYEAKPGLGNFSAAGVALVLLAMLAVALRGLFPGRDSKLAKNLNRQLNGDKGKKGLVATVDSHEDRLKVVEERVGTVEDKTEVLEQLALQDIDFDEDNANLGDLQSGEENAVVWKIFKKGDATRYYQVTIGRLDDTPSGKVFTDIPRKKGGEPVNTPFAISTLELKILKAINDGRLEPVLLKPSLNGAVDTSRHVN